MPVCRPALPGLMLALALVTLAGCAWLPQSDAGGAFRVSGMMNMTAEGARLETCSGEAYELQVDENLRSIFNQVAKPAQTAIFIDLHGEVLADNSINPERILRMGSVGDGCSDQVAGQSQWVAVGERPDWQVRIAPAGLQMTTLGDEWQSIIVEQMPEGIRSFRTLEGETVELWLYPQPCFSRLNGHYYHNSARLLTAGESFAGCAYPGRLAASQSFSD